MKVIFLDIDGVLNSDRTIRACPVEGTDADAPYRVRYLLCKCDPIAVKLLNKVTRETGAKIVVSSANRIILGFAGCKDILAKMGVEAEIIGITASGLGIRGDEIADWLDELGHPEVTHYAILDDSCDMRPEQMENFVRVDARYGISFDNTVQLNKILGVNSESIILLP